MRTKTPPPLKRHKGTGQAYVRVSGQFVYLGPWGSPRAQRAYRELVAAWATTGGLPAPAADLTVEELLGRYLTYAEGYYRDAEGSPTSEVGALRLAMKPVRALYADIPAVEFGPNALRLVRDQFLGQGLVRTSINKHVSRVRMMFKWAASRELLPVTVYQALATVEPLKRGRSEASESDPIRPVEVGEVSATLPYLSRQVAALVRLQQLTGMRPGEVVLMRPADIERGSDGVWIYRPSRHKTEHHGKAREVFLGPKAQKLLAPWLSGRPATSYCFSPAEAERERRERLHAARKTPMSCGNVPGSNRNEDAPRKLGECYTTSSYRRAVHRGVESLNAKRREDAEKRGEEPVLLTKWNPNQLRHSVGTEVRARFGLEAAQVVLGHAQANVTEVYAERDRDLARRIAKEVG